MGEKPKRILAHICCAVDAIYFLKRLREDFPEAEIIGFFYDPNIHPYEEYLLRLKESERACKLLGIKFIEGEYNLKGWLERVKGLENEPEKGARCAICFDERLKRSVKKAKELGCDAFTTTLLMSPKKSQKQLERVGKKLERAHGVKYLHLDYRKGGGVQEMNRLVREKEIWRQDYCGCLFALIQQKGENSLLDLVGFPGRLPGTKEEHLFTRTFKVFAELLDLPVREEEFTLLGWFPLRGYLKVVGGEVIPSLVKPFSAPIRGKVRADITGRVGNRLYLNKQNAVVELVDRAKPLEFPFASNPTFWVHPEYEKLILSGRLEATLEVETKFVPSRNLIVGNPERAREIFLAPADTLADGQGVKMEKLEGFLKSLAEDIRSERAAFVLLGAQSYGVGKAELLSRHSEAFSKLRPAPLEGNFLT